MESSSQSESLVIAQWLVSDEAARGLAWLETQDRHAIATLTKLRDDLDSEKASALLQQADLRKRAARKFTHAEQMFLTDIGLQQSTDQEIAAYKAKRFPAGQTIADLCCGIGGDLIALAGQGPTTAVDVSAEHLIYAEANVHAHGAKLADTCCGLAEAFPLEDFAAWHIDPDRRSENRRATRVESFRPTLEQLEEMLRRNGNAALKLAPASSVPEAWLEQGLCEWITHHRECKQLVVWLGSLSEKPGIRRATRIDGNDQVASFAGVPISVKRSTELAAFLFDPDPSLVVSGLVDALAETLSLARISPQSHYLTGGEPIDHPLLQAFEVVGNEKVDTKKLKRAVSQAGWGTLELKQRGLELKLEALRKQLKPSGAGEGTIVFTPTVEGNRAILCQRVVP